MKKYKAIAIPVSLPMGNQGFSRYEIQDSRIGYLSQEDAGEEKFLNPIRCALRD